MRAPAVRAPRRLPARHGGVALVAVLWIVAALSLLAAGLSQTTRAQIDTASVQRDAAVGQALGDGAIHIALQALLAETRRPPGVQTASIVYQGVAIQVEAAPLDGLISLNGADVPLLAQMLHNAGGLAPGAAEALARQLVQWRSERPPADPTSPAAAALSQQRRFEAPEDLMLVPGVDYTLYARIAPLVSADLSTGKVNALAAPPDVLAALAPGDPGRIARFAAQLAAGQPGVDSSFLDGRFTTSSGGGGTELYRLRASVPLDAGRILVLTRDVSLATDPVHLLPWRFLRQSRQLLSAGAASS